MSPTAEQIAWLFVSQYFKRLHSDPSELHHFYDVDAKLLHGKEQDDAAAVSGTESIQERISQLHTQGCKTLISCLDAMEGPNKSILIQIIGQMSSSDDGVPQKFVQSVVLESKSGTNYSIYSDVFRFLKDEDDDKDEPKEAAEEEVKEAPKEAPKEETSAASEAPKEEPKEVPAEPTPAPAPEAKKEEAKEAPAPEAKESPKEEPKESPKEAAPEPAKPSGPISWAARARSSDKPAPAETPSPVAAAAVAKKEPSSSPTVAAATTSASAASGARKGLFHSAYIKGVDTTTDMGVVETALQKIGNGIVHFEITKNKNGVFVDFADAASLKKALELRELKVGDMTIIIDERKRRKPGSGSAANGSSSSAGASGNRDSSKRQGTKRR
ncbi:hypothetical protein CJU89_3076 [Yarrowia sp. B02]|nr:hypothetical protein CJU89_3076 [Yarrowia sp. B02]